MGLLPQLGMLEVILLAAVTLVVVGPKELPRFLKGVGQFVAQLQTMAMEFKGTMNEMIRESELDEIRREIDQLTRLGPAAELDQAFREFEETSRDIEREMTSAIEGPSTGELVADAHETSALAESGSLESGPEVSGIDGPGGDGLPSKAGAKTQKKDAQAPTTPIDGGRDSLGASPEGTLAPTRKSADVQDADQPANTPSGMVLPGAGEAETKAARRADKTSGQYVSKI